MSRDEHILHVKARLVAAHRAGDWALASQLSQERQRLKRKPNTFGVCRVCGVAVRRPKRLPDGSLRPVEFCSVHRRLAQAGMLSALPLVIGLLAGCATKPQPVAMAPGLPPLPPEVERRTMAESAAPLPPRQWFLAWDYPTDRPAPDRFRVERCDGLTSDWVLMDLVPFSEGSNAGPNVLTWYWGPVVNGFYRVGSE